MRFFFLFFFVVSVSAQSIPVSEGENFKNVFYSSVQNRVYFIYEDFGVKYDLVNWTSEKIILNNQRANNSLIHHVSINKKDYLLDQLGGMVYEFKNDSLHRIDNSFTHKMQLDASVFVYDNNFYKYGGYGFWSFRNFITKFNFSTKEWDLVPFFKSNEIPKGSSNSYVKIIGDYLYVLGGIQGVKNNPLLSEENTEVWRFDMKNHIWNNLGTLNIPTQKIILDKIVDYGDLTLIFGGSKVYRLDLKNNKFEFFEQNKNFMKMSTLTKPFVIDDKLIFSYYEGQEDDVLRIGKRSIDTVFGSLIASGTIIKNNSFVFIILCCMLFFVLLYVLYVFLKRRKENLKKIVLTKSGEFLYRGKIIHLGVLEANMLNLLVRSKTPVHASDFLNIMDTPQFNYSHQTRILNDAIHKINNLYATLLQNEDELIVVSKSKLDKRLKEYTVDGGLFRIQKR